MIHFAYPANFLGAKWFASHGVPMYVRLDVFFDHEALVYVATSSQVKGLVLEAKTLDEIKSEADRLIPELLTIEDSNSVEIPKLQISAAFA